MRPQPSIEQLPADRARQLMATPYTYPDVGATRHHPLPADARMSHREILVGHGRACFDRAAEQLFTWQLHRRAGLIMAVSAGRVDVGVISVAGLPLGPLIVRAPCRVVYVIIERQRVAFAYGTLPGHPLAGEERFEFRWEDDDSVWFELRLFSRPASPLARLGGPITNRVQATVNRRYLTAARS